jgi:hypothetical protein
MEPSPSGHALMVGDDIYTYKPFPTYMKNPGKFRWIIYLNGLFVGAGRTKAQVEGDIRRGKYKDELTGKPIVW